MDYKYIEQLLERYWLCETSLEEEQILRAFFAQSEIPAHLMQYQSLFSYQMEQPKNEFLGEDFDQKILEAIHVPVVKAQPLTLLSRFSGLMRAAAAVAVICLLSGAAQQLFSPSESVASYKSAVGTSDPQVASQSTTSNKQISRVAIADSIVRASATE
ncbi:MAG: hypothetical protein KBH23_04030 [Bacteroidaceae bacterium]|nr:hypothetical protein [Bacteroidaceae bacterium]MBP9637110.1 hypothetical protein [Bacteroidaceae bacterium]